MSMGTEVTIDRGVATIRPASPENAAALLEAAGRDGVATITGIGGLAFRVTEEHAVAAGLVDVPPAEPEPEPEPDPEGGDEEPPTEPGDAPAGDDSPQTLNEAQAPSRGASTDAWRTFLDEQGVTYSEEDRRDDLVALWESR